VESGASFAYISEGEQPLDARLRRVPRIPLWPQDRNDCERLRNPPSTNARGNCRRQGCTNIELKIANGYHGWSEHAPFDKVIVTAAPDLIPPPLIHQLKAGGKMVIPAGLPDAQQLVLVEKNGNGKVTTKEILRVRFSQLEETEPGITSN